MRSRKPGGLPDPSAVAATLTGSFYQGRHSTSATSSGVLSLPALRTRSMNAAYARSIRARRLSVEDSEAVAEQLGAQGWSVLGPLLCGEGVPDRSRDRGLSQARGRPPKRDGMQYQYLRRVKMSCVQMSSAQADTTWHSRRSTAEAES